MGNFFSKKPDPEIEQFINERLENFNIIKSNLQDFDLIFFSGDSFTSSCVKYCEKRQLDIPVGNVVYSHVGIVLTSKVLKHPKVKEGTQYIWESCVSWGGVKDILYDETFLGVQLRELEPVIKDYYRSSGVNTVISLGLLQSNFRINLERNFNLTNFNIFFDKYNHTIYEIEPFNLLGSIFPFFRKQRNEINDEIIKSDSFIFCSELAALLYMQLKIYTSLVNPSNVVPMDIIGYDADKKNGVNHVFMPLVKI
jgi:hypothetical protein